MLTIDKIRRLANYYNTTPKYNGIGMIRLRVAPRRSCLFYSKLSESINNTIHDHRYSYTSFVVKGTIRNYVYEYNRANCNTNFTLIRKDMNKDGTKSRHATPNIEMTESCSFDTTERQKYYMHEKTLHYIEPRTPKLITLLITDPTPWRQTANFITDKRVQLISPLDRPKSEKECWEIIEYTLND